MREKLHFKGLNGLRAIAALAVVFSHTTLALKEFGLNSFFWGINPDGTPRTTLLAGFGVSIFFALSGFLITYLLLVEKEKKTIDIKKFYIRRILRIFPLYYLYLVLVILLLYVYTISYNKLLLLAYLLPFANIPSILSTSIPLLGHYWSLAVEEQFYLFWPWLLRYKNQLFKWALGLTMVLLVIKLGLRFWAIQTGVELPYLIAHVCRFQCMLIGALGAFIYLGQHAFTLKILKSWPAQVVAWLCMVLALINRFHVVSVLDNELFSLVTLVLIIGQIENGPKIISLENKVMNFIGQISYGVYLYHPLIIFLLAQYLHFDEPTTGRVLLVYTAIFLLTIVIATLSYFGFERHFLKWKEKFT